MMKASIASREMQLTDREIEFLKLACTEMTYKEIAAKMYLSPGPLMGIGTLCFKNSI
jgi:DNA-binding CsgD family transcriptional regulator